MLLKFYTALLDIHGAVRQHRLKVVHGRHLAGLPHTQLVNEVQENYLHALK